MKLLSITLLAVTTLSFFGCSKWKKDKKDASYYYSKDYKLSQGEILGVDIEEIDMLYTVFFYEGKNLKYKLVAEKKVNDSNKNEVLSYEYGSVEVDKNYTLLFTPTVNGNTSYTGAFETKDKKAFDANLPDFEGRTLRFILKK